MKLVHIPVLTKQVLGYLAPKPNENFIDCTAGQGGHSLAILKKNGPKGKVLAIDRDPCVLKTAGYRIQNKEYKDRIIFVCSNFANLKEIAEQKKFGPVHGILFDLGLSSWHLRQSGRGFSFQKDEPLDMRFNKDLEQSITASQIVNKRPASEIEKILKQYSQERWAGKISREIVRARKTGPINTTFQLIEIIKSAVPKNYERRRIHPATRTFQALRIAVNDELANLEKALLAAVDQLADSGRLIVISFHSLEDRIVKQFFKQKAKENKIKILTKKPIRPCQEEISKNPGSRSAKLRAAVIINNQ